MAKFVMPTLGADMSEGTLVRWLKRPGEFIKKGEILAEIETSKGVIEVESFATGMLEKILVEPLTEVPVGTVLALIREEEKGLTEAIETPSTGMPTDVSVAPTVQAETPLLPGVSLEGGHLKASPAAKKLAHDLGIDLTGIQGTGPGGVITREDIKHTAKGKEKTLLTEPSPSSGTLQTATGCWEEPREKSARQVWMRETIAAAMARSKREIPHYYLSTTIDMGSAIAWLVAENVKRSVSDRLLYGVLLLKAVALALREIPELNSLWKEKQSIQSQAIHVGVAISLRGGGLVAPALHDTDKQNLNDLMRNFRGLVKRARAGALRASELSDPTITVTSLGEQGVESTFAVIYPPQTAIVGFGKIVERPWLVNGQVVARPVITATLSADHRVTDGHRGGLFLSAVERFLQEPGKL